MWRALLFIAVLCSCNRSEEIKKQQEIDAEKRSRQSVDSQERDDKRKLIAEALIGIAKQFLEEDKKDDALNVLMDVDPRNRDKEWKELYKKAGGVLTDEEK